MKAGLKTALSFESFLFRYRLLNVIFSSHSAQNGGRQAAFENAAKMGIRQQKKWRATHDMRTRHAHRMLDGEIVPYDQPFTAAGTPIMFPGDPDAPPAMVYNCRCTMQTGNDIELEAEPHEMLVRNPFTGRNEVVTEKSYKEWYAEHQKKNPDGLAAEEKKIRYQASDKEQHKRYRNILGKEIPKKFADFQYLKYNTPEQWENIKERKKQTVYINNAPCVTTEKKFTGFFLRPEAKHSKDFFEIGYTQDNPLQLRYDMALNFDMKKAKHIETNEKGETTFRIYMSLGITEKKRFRTAWQIDKPGDLPRIITAFRDDKDV